MKILTIIGARPQFIKASTVSRAIRCHNADVEASHSTKKIQEVVVHTGQHYDKDLSDVFFEELDIPPPDHYLGIGNLSHGAMTGRMLEKIETLIYSEEPDWVLVYGDTNSTLAGALAAAKIHVPVCHVEAGLRSNNCQMPEEVNRILTDRVSTLLLCPTETSIQNLKNEGYPFSSASVREQRIVNVGDVMYDAVLFYRVTARERIGLDRWNLDEGAYGLCTLHRQENTDDPERLLSIFSALREISRDLPIVLPLHPRTRRKLEEAGMMAALRGIRAILPVSYLEIQRLQMGACIILTDSGGMQKEAYFHGVPCITLRDETEWVETVTTGWNQLVGADQARIVQAFREREIPVKKSEDVYGLGNASALVVKQLIQI